MIIRPHVTQCSEVVVTKEKERGTRRNRVVMSMYRNRHTHTHREREISLVHVYLGMIGVSYLGWRVALT